MSKQRKDEQKIRAPHLVFSHQKQTPSRIALRHFDDHYGKALGAKGWASARLALMSRPTYAALANNFADAEAAGEALEAIGCERLEPRFNISGRIEDDEDAASATKSSQKPPPPRPVLQSQEDEGEDDVAKPDLDRSLPKEEHMLQGRMIASKELIFGTNVDATAMYDFVPTTKLKGNEEFVEETEFYDRYESIDTSSAVPIDVLPEKHLVFPALLNAYGYKRGSSSHIPTPDIDEVSGLPLYHGIDLAMLLPIVALNLRPGEDVLDMNAGTSGGTHTMSLAQTMMPRRIICAEEHAMPLKQVQMTVKRHMRGSPMLPCIEFLKRRPYELPVEFSDKFDKILCHVPSTNDRYAVHCNDDNVFNPKWKRTRLQLPETQINQLGSAFQCLKAGGSLVYVTSAMSPVQNDGVVQETLRILWEKTRTEYHVRDLTGIIKPFKQHLRIAGKGRHDLKYGVLVKPHISMNCGPLYMAKIARTA